MEIQVRTGYYPIIRGVSTLENITLDEFSDYAADLMLFPETAIGQYEEWISSHLTNLNTPELENSDIYVKKDMMPLALPGSIYLKDSINNLRCFGAKRFLLLQLIDPVGMYLDVLISPRNVGYGYIDYMQPDTVVSWLVGIPHPTKAGNILVSDSIIRKCASWAYYDYDPAP